MESRTFLKVSGCRYQWLLGAPDGWLCAFFVLSWCYFGHHDLRTGMPWLGAILLAGALLLGWSHYLTLTQAQLEDSSHGLNLKQKLAELDLPGELQELAWAEEQRMDQDWKSLLASHGLDLIEDPDPKPGVKAVVHGGAFFAAGSLLALTGLIQPHGYVWLAGTAALGLLLFGWARHRLLNWEWSASVGLLVSYGLLLAALAAVLGPHI